MSGMVCSCELNIIIYKICYVQAFGFWRRALCEEDVAESVDSIASAAGEDGREIYQKGAFRSSGLGSVDAYLVRKAGMYPDVVERLAMNHIQKGDKMSALITAEWCVNPTSHYAQPWRMV